MNFTFSSWHARWASLAIVPCILFAEPAVGQIAITADMTLGTTYDGTILELTTSPGDPSTWEYFTFSAEAGRKIRVEVDRRTPEMDPASGTWVGNAAGLNYSDFISIFESGLLPQVGAGDDDDPPATATGDFGDPFYSFIAPTSGAYTAAVSGFANEPMPPGGYKFSITISEVVDWVVESREGGQNFDQYSETGEFANTSGKSLVPEATPGIGARFGSTFTSVVGPKHALFAPDLPTAGLYNVFTTWGNVGNRRADVLHEITHLDGTTDVLVDQNDGNGFWFHLGAFRFAAGLGGSVDISNTGLDLSGNFVADAVMWELLEAVPEPRSAGLLAPALAVGFTWLSTVKRRAAWRARRPAADRRLSNCL
jgi:hypothetical protein